MIDKNIQQRDLLFQILRGCRGKQKRINNRSDAKLQENIKIPQPLFPGLVKRKGKRNKLHISGVPG